jgi:DNA replication protein DnaC
MRKLPANAAEDLLEIVMRRYERGSTILTSNRPLDDWPKLFGDTPAVAAFLDRLMHLLARLYARKLTTPAGPF